MSQSALRSEEHTSELQSQSNLVCRLLLEKKKILSVQDSHSPDSHRDDLMPDCFYSSLPSISSHSFARLPLLLLFFFNDTATTEIYTLSLHDALPICRPGRSRPPPSCAKLARCRADLCRRPASRSDS